MAADHIDPDISTTDLRRLYYELGPPFTPSTPTSQVERFVRVCHMLQERRPSEHESAGERIMLESIGATLAEAKRFVAIRGLRVARPRLWHGDLRCQP